MAKNNPKIHFFGGARKVDGSNYMLEVGKDKILIDVGLHQSGDSRELNLKKFPFNPKEIKVIIITHAHIDHVGLLPRLYKEGFRGKIYSTPPTKSFAEIMLEDSQRILEKEEKIAPYSIEDIQKTLDLWETMEYHINKEISPNISFVFYNAGHILGSVITLVTAKPSPQEETKIVFSGDLGNSYNMLFPEPEKLSEGDYCLIESTYGDRLHEDLGSKKDILEDIIEETARNNGVLMIPAFAMERTQELLFELNELIQKEKIPQLPIFVDSPLATKITNVHRKYQSYFRLEAFKVVDRDPDGFFNFPGLKFTLSTDESKSINDIPAPKIIVAGSGSSQGGRIIHHEKRYLPDPNSTLLVVGYQMKGSLGRRLIEGEKKVRIHGEDVLVRAKIEMISAYSAHADQKQLLNWLKPMRFSLKKLFVVQGDEESSMAFAEKSRNSFGIDAVIPVHGQVIELETRRIEK